ncbi:hypothetical protein ASPZODRAFT_135796 [Penicilliopsis zonata CBS 506.65]|uniref:FCP1 homology domain-containing protein n=1 Tax=Penicilliopsis zonata CBS 506.65 TaxID=1073090 RepID=A0A1L9S9E7_9EURO|nr:hypothetical protein ASPZODRAFT_135796 [Penicilliopsis zonata CBS 506.65]OJJ43774.1 hypothetical protein ASPZODRAFT_135796 [Penicilliopsis zonata CBS 506.65]
MVNYAVLISQFLFGSIEPRFPVFQSACVALHTSLQRMFPGGAPNRASSSYPPSKRQKRGVDMYHQNSSQEEVIYNSNGSWRSYNDRWSVKQSSASSREDTTAGGQAVAGNGLRGPPEQHQHQPRDLPSSLPLREVASIQANVDVNQSQYQDGYSQQYHQNQHQNPWPMQMQMPFVPNPFMSLPLQMMPMSMPMWNNANGQLPFDNPQFASAFLNQNFAGMPSYNNNYNNNDDNNRTSMGTPSARRERVSRPLAAPKPTKEYLAQSSLPPQPSASPQPLLVILDLNGTLIYRAHRRLPPVFVKRPGLDEFLDTLMQRYTVMIWSSSQPPTVQAICAQLFPGEKRKALAAEWGRDKFGLTKSQYHGKIQVYKQLKTVWADPSIQARFPSDRSHSGADRRWDQSNTVLIDDSKLKAASEPLNILEVPEFTNLRGVDESGVFPNVLRKLEKLALSDDVSKTIQSWNSHERVISRDANGNLENSGIGTGPAAIEALPSSETKRQKRQARKKEKLAACQAAKETLTTTDNSTEPAIKQQQSEPPVSASTLGTGTPSEAAEARIQRRKAKKQEKKAARRAAAAATAVSGETKSAENIKDSTTHQNANANANKTTNKGKNKGNGKGNGTVSTTSKSRPKRTAAIAAAVAIAAEISQLNSAQAAAAPVVSSSLQMERSVSPVSTASENHLLDRLEESLGL